MPAPTSQYTRQHWVTVPIASWGAAFNHAHDLNDGEGNGYTPNNAEVNRAYVVVGGVNYPIETGVVRVTAVGAANISVIVGESTALAPVLLAALTSKFGAVPTSVLVDVTTRFIHSQEIGPTAVANEALNLPANANLPVSLYPGAPASLQTIFVRTAGADTNDGTTVATALLTLQAAFNQIMQQSPLYHDVMVDVGGGTFAGNATLEGVVCRNGAGVYVIGAVPTVVTKTSVSGGAAGFAAVHDHSMIRLTPDAAFDVAPVAGDIGRTLRITNGTNVAFATIGWTTNGGAGAANQIMDLTMDPVLTGAAPAWTTAAATTYAVLDETNAGVTRITGNVNIFNVTKTQGAAGQGTGNHTAKHNLIGHIRFDTGAVVIQGCDRFSFHGSRFENGLPITSSRDCSNTANSVPLAGLARYWPAAVWTRLGYSDGAGGTIAGTANGYGGCGYHVAGAAHTISTSDGTVQGLTVATGQTLTIGTNADIAFVGCSVDAVLVQLRGACAFSYTHFNGQLRTDTDGKFLLSDFNSWLARTGTAEIPDTLANNPVNNATGLIRIQGSGKGFVTLGAVTRLEGHNSAGAVANNGNVAVRVDTGGTLYWTGGHDANFYGQGGWLMARDCAVVYLSGTRTMAAKGVATAAHSDWDIADGVLMRSIGDITHAAADNTPGPVIDLDYGAVWVHGDVAADTGLFVVGNGAGAGIDCGAAEAIGVRHGSHLTLAVPRVYNSNAGAGVLSLTVQHRSEFFAAAVAGVNSCYLLGNAAGGGPGAASVRVGVSAALVAPNPLVAAIRNDLPAAPAGTEQLCYYQIE